MTRRMLLSVGMLLATLLSCSRKEESNQVSKELAPMNDIKRAPSAPPMASDPPASAWSWKEKANQPWAGLQIHQAGASLASARRVLVLFHGYGARGDDLAGLANVLDAGPQTAFLFPAAPVSLPQGGRAWFRRDRSNFEDGFQRAQALLSYLNHEHPQLPIVVGGFSQGAMLASNLVASSSSQVAGCLILSPANLMHHAPGPDSIRFPIFISHGQLDAILPFSEGEAVRDFFQEKNYPVTWVPFRGTHTIFPSSIGKINQFLVQAFAQHEKLTQPTK